MSPAGIEPTYGRHERPVLTVKLWAPAIQSRKLFYVHTIRSVPLNKNI